jgi:deazaflavin-dependent oxidoreductase (nitroreductase family)
MVRLIGGAVVAVAALAACFVVGMRTKNPAVQDRVRRFARDVGNPRVLRRAGQPGVPAAVLRHVGRVSGRTYETPVVPHPVDGDYVIALPYGPSADWVRNVLAAGSATVVHDGSTVVVREPRVVPTAHVASRLPESEQRTLRVFAVDECLRVTPEVVDAAAPATPAS